MKIKFLFKNNQHRSAKVCAALQRSVVNQGHQIWSDENTADMLCVYGMGPSHKASVERFKALGKPCLIIDLGYWNRNYGAGIQCAYKFSLNNHHPNDLMADLKMPKDKFDKLGFRIEPWRERGTHILLAGMGKKSYELYGLPDQSWDLWAVNEIRKHTKRPIIYRPKPSWKNCPPIHGTTYSPPDQLLSVPLSQSWCTVSHHSNVAVDGLLMGIPSFTWDGAALSVSSQDLSQIESPYKPKHRDQFFWNLAYFNWSIADIEAGHCWNFFWNHWLRDWK